MKENNERRVDCEFVSNSEKVATEYANDKCPDGMVLAIRQSDVLYFYIVTLEQFEKMAEGHSKDCQVSFNPRRVKII